MTGDTTRLLEGIAESNKERKPFPSWWDRNVTPPRTVQYGSHQPHGAKGHLKRGLFELRCGVSVKYTLHLEGGMRKV